MIETPHWRPPSEAGSMLLLATRGCSWNHCTYCAMYRHQPFEVRPLEELLAEVARAGEQVGARVHKVFVGDGDALVLPMEHWERLLVACKQAFPRLRQVSCYATARNLLEKSPAELQRLRELRLRLLYIGPESGDDVTLRRIAKGADHAQHVEAARRAHAAGMRLSCIFLLGAGGVERSQEHAEGSAALATAMDPRFLSLLTLTVIPGTPLGLLQERGAFQLPDVRGFLQELRTFVAHASPTEAIFRTNHASNYLPLEGRLSRDRDELLAVLDQALRGDRPLRPEWSRGL